jgi:photosystem II stability/assembly factor-like uncharacterized protein
LARLQGWGRSQWHRSQSSKLFPSPPTRGHKHDFGLCIRASTSAAFAPQPQENNMPPPHLEDNPERRYHAQMADRHSGGREGHDLAGLRHAALTHSAAMAFAREMPTAPIAPGQNNWTQLGPLGIASGQTVGSAERVIVTGRVTEIVPHPTDADTIYVGTARGGVWKTTDSGKSWTAKSDNADSTAIGSLAISRSRPDTLYAGTGEGNIFYFVTTFPLSSINASYNGSGILKTTDGGATWKTQGGGTGGVFTGACFYRVRVHPSDPDTVLAATSRGVYRTTDGGANWARLSGGLPSISTSIIAATDVAFDPVTPATAYAAFWGSGVYKCTDIKGSAPSWTKLGGGLPTTGLRRISIAVAPSAPQNLYALIGAVTANDDAFKGLYVSANGGGTWTLVPLSAVETAESYTNSITVAAGDPNIVYVSGTSLYTAVRSAGTWAVTAIGANIHADHHALAGHPSSDQTIYAGCDGGIYKSMDGGATWDDSINEGLCITQLESLDQHPQAEAVVIAGTQDNGTLQYRNSPAFYHSADGDGGFCAIDQSEPRNVIHTYYQNSPERSTEGGNFGTYADISGGIAGDGLFYPPLAFDRTTIGNVAFGTDVINLDPAQGTAGWPTQVQLPGITGRVSVISYIRNDLIYAGTSAGEVYRLTRSGSTWTANAIHGSPLPGQWIWGLSTLFTDLNTLIVAMAGFGTPAAPLAHVWRGVVASGGASAVWTDISGTAPNRLPDIPVNALCLGNEPKTYYVGTDIGVYRTTDAGSSWQPFSAGLPNVAIYDLQLHPQGNLLRAATHGRGLWQRNVRTASTPNVDIYVRRNLWDGMLPVSTLDSMPATYDEPLQGIKIGDLLWSTMCADIKVDAPQAGTPNYQMNVAEVDYFAFETKLAHRAPRRSTAQRQVTNRLYVQIHNRGIQSASKVRVKVLYCERIFDLPPTFWTKFPNDPDPFNQVWKPIGAYKEIASISPTRPEMLEWDWVLPSETWKNVSVLVVVDCAADPIPEANKLFDPVGLIKTDKRVGMRTMSVIDAAP